jgi:Tfp pilus assembly protein PilO
MKNSTALILILISVGLFYTFIMPEFSHVQNLRVQAGSYNDVLSNVTDLSQKRDELLLKYNAIPKDQLANLEKILPSNVNVVELALNLDAIASKYGISIKDVKTIDEKSDQTATTIKTPSSSGYQKVNISFIFVSNYANFRKFIADLEQSLRIIDVKTISFETADSGFNEYQIQIQTYWLK